MPLAFRIRASARSRVCACGPTPPRGDSIQTRSKRAARLVRDVGLVVAPGEVVDRRGVAHAHHPEALVDRREQVRREEVARQHRDRVRVRGARLTQQRAQRWKVLERVHLRGASERASQRRASNDEGAAIRPFRRPLLFASSRSMAHGENDCCSRQ